MQQNLKEIYSKKVDFKIRDRVRLNDSVWTKEKHCVYCEDKGLTPVYYPYTSGYHHNEVLEGIVEKVDKRIVWAKYKHGREYPNGHLIGVGPQDRRLSKIKTKKENLNKSKRFYSFIRRIFYKN